MIRIPSIRSAFLAAFLFSAALMRAAALESEPGPKLGLQSWTCRNMTFEQVVDFAVQHHITYIEFIAAHLDPAGTKEETMRKKALLDQKGLVAYSFGVNRPGLD